MLYNRAMEVPVTQFRKNLFALIARANAGEQVWVRHKGRRLRIVPEREPADKLSRITPIDIFVSEGDIQDESWHEEMMREWERKWDRRLETGPQTRRRAPARPRGRSTGVRKRT